MMFSLAAAEIGIQAAELSKLDLWSKGRMWHALPAIVHLLVAAFIISASWVGWRRSTASLGIHDVTDVLSLPFFILMLDVLLVVVYFIFVKSVRIEDSNGVPIVEVSARKDCFWILIVFGGYFAWDVLTKFRTPGFLLRTSVSFTCWLLAGVCWWHLAEVTDRWRIIVTDLALLSLLLLFRAGKDCVTAAGPRQRNESGLAFRNRRAKLARSGVCTGVFFVVLYMFFSLAKWGSFGCLFAIYRFR